jgi:hypothetical protein
MDKSEVDGDQLASTEGDIPDVGGAGVGDAAEIEVDPATGVPLEDLMLSMAHIGTSVADPDNDQSNPNEVPDADPVDRGGAPVIAGFHKIDFNDDDAIDEMVSGIGDAYEAAVKAAGLKMAPRGSLKVISEGGVPVEDTE